MSAVRGSDPDSPAPAAQASGRRYLRRRRGDASRGPGASSAPGGALHLPFVKKAKFAIEASPALLGVGYILGFRIATIMVCGAALSYLIIVPFIAHMWGARSSRRPPTSSTTSPSVR